MVNDFVEAPKSLGRSLNFAAGATNALCNARLAPHGLQLPQWVVLSSLWRKDGLTVTQIAQLNGSAVPAASRLVGRMEKAGFVSRRPDPDDRRETRVWCTPRGRALDGLARFHESINDALLDGFTEAEAEALFALLDRVTENARRAQG